MKSLTKAEVFSRINNYVAEIGVEPNCKELLAYIGRGSMGTVHKYLSEWRHQHQYTSTVFKDDDSAATILLPPAIGEAWARETARLQAAMTKEMQALRDSYDNEVRLLEEELVILQEELKRQETEIENKDRQNRELTELLYHLSGSERGNFEASRKLRVIQDDGIAC
jgi:hypothetical protein